MNCPICEHEMIECSEEYSKYTNGFIKVKELICELHDPMNRENWFHNV